jgi:hypothetical protein
MNIFFPNSKVTTITKEKIVPIKVTKKQNVHQRPANPAAGEKTGLPTLHKNLYKVLLKNYFPNLDLMVKNNILIYQLPVARTAINFVPE